MMTFLTACSAVKKLQAIYRLGTYLFGRPWDAMMTCKLWVPFAGKGVGGLAEKEAIGVSAEIEQEDGKVRDIDVQAPAVLCAGNAIATPALLLKSGIDGRGQVGAHLQAHPIAAIRGVFPEVSCRFILRLHAHSP